MLKIEYPALYKASDKLSIDQQRYFYYVLFTNLICLVLGGLIPLINSKDPCVAIFQFLLLLMALGCSLFLTFFEFEKNWYASRAIAESIKTTTWRYTTKSVPFNSSDRDAKSKFLAALNSIIVQNKELTGKFDAYLADDQISVSMVAIRALNLEARKKLYMQQRVKEQHTWYAGKSNFNKSAARKYFAALIAFNSFAVICAALKINNPAFGYWPIDILITLAASTLAWMQAKKYSEHASSYSLAANEISLIKSGADEIESENDLSEFVLNAENAFSREHTQWVARKHRDLQ